MRVIRKYYFNIGTKIPFSTLPEIVHCFMAEQGLTSNRFLYYFEDYVYDHAREGEKPKRNSCEMILKDCPSLGEIRIYKEKERTNCCTQWLSNIDGNAPFPEERILPLMGKIHRYYGFAHCELYYFDMDFFKNRIPFERDYSWARQRCNADGIVFDPTVCIDTQPYGSGIVLHRDNLGDNYLGLFVDLLCNGEMFDPSPYYEAMKALLPKIRSESFLNFYFTDEERRQFAETDQQAMPMIEECRTFFKERLFYEKHQNAISSDYSVATPLKKLAKQYGYTYRLVYQGIYSLEKRTPRGAVLQIQVDVGVSRYSIGAIVQLHGIGFKHLLGVSGKAVQTQEEVNAFLEQAVRIVSDFEDTMLPSLDALFPQTPSWFTPFV